MTAITIDAELREKLLAAGEAVELRDESGKLVAVAYVPTPSTGSAETRIYERFTDRSRRVMRLANKEAERFRHEYIGTEHILLGLVLEGAGVAANVLQNLNVDPDKARREVEKLVVFGPDEPLATGRLPQTPRARKVIEYAVEEARSLKHNYVGTEHLLLGLIREEEGIASVVLNNLGLTLGKVRREVLNLLGHLPGEPPSA